MQDTLTENEELPLFLSISRININPRKKLQATIQQNPYERTRIRTELGYFSSTKKDINL